MPSSKLGFSSCLATADAWVRQIRNSQVHMYYLHLSLWIWRTMYKNGCMPKQLMRYLYYTTWIQDEGLHFQIHCGCVKRPNYKNVVPHFHTLMDLIVFWPISDVLKSTTSTINIMQFNDTVHCDQYFNNCVCEGLTWTHSKARTLGIQKFIYVLF